jgi:cyclic pyranopterin phosphate synthase
LPDGPHNLLARQDYLTVSHYEAAACALRHIAVDKIRFTGGEPTLRKDLPAIVRAFSKKISVPLGITTNGLGFFAMKDALVDAGLSAITFHLDTLKENRYRALMGRGSVQKVKTAIALAKRMDLLVKINVVVQKALNDDELVDFLYFSRAHDVEVRFIEQMNTGFARAHVARTFMSGKEILAAIASSTPIKERQRKDPSAPAEQFYAEELALVFGLIASDTRPFCQACNRLRINADGTIRTCLYEPVGIDVGFGKPLGEDELRKNILAAIAMKRSFHPASNLARRDFAMAQIGG